MGEGGSWGKQYMGEIAVTQNRKRERKQILAYRGGAEKKIKFAHLKVREIRDTAGGRKTKARGARLGESGRAVCGETIDQTKKQAASGMTAAKFGDAGTDQGIRRGETRLMWQGREMGREKPGGAAELLPARGVGWDQNGDGNNYFWTGMFRLQVRTHGEGATKSS